MTSIDHETSVHSLQLLVLTLTLPASKLAGRCHLAIRAVCRRRDGPDMWRTDSGNMAWSLQPCSYYVG